MCEQGDHYIEYTTAGCKVLCFRHAVIASISGEFVDVSVYTQEVGECEVCEEEFQAQREKEKQGP